MTVAQLQVVPVEAWDTPATAEAIEDSLLDCLLILCKALGKPMSRAALTAGLPLVDHRLTPELFVRAAARGGISAAVRKRALESISDLVLPAVLLLDGRQACVLMRIGSSSNATIVLPDSGAGERDIEFDELQRRYAGQVIFARPAHAFDARSSDNALPRVRHWFHDVVARAWPIYGEVLVAS